MKQIYKVVPTKDESAPGTFDVICTRGNVIVNNGLSYTKALADAHERQTDYEALEG